MSPDKSPPIAVVGIGCRFPGGATTAGKLWDILAQGKSTWSEIPPERMDIGDHYHPNGRRQGTICFRGAHFLGEDPFAWDASFFETSAKEAIAIDPQQRLLLEVTYEALENAGICRESIDGTDTGVFCGSFVKDYEQVCLKDPDDAPQYAATGNGIALLSNRISYAFNLKGPSMTMDTGCSASLAIVAGPGLILTPNTMMPMMGLNFLSPDGKCYTFDSRANGYGRGEGVGVIVLKRLHDAMADRNPIRCVVRGTSVNQDGKTPQGITVPSMEAQVANIRKVYKRSGLGYEQTAFVECHGTGTQAGDSRELGAIAETISRGRPTPVVVGSIKTNIGHLEGAAGVAGVTKMILCLENGIIPSHINFEGNPAFDFKGMNIQVPLEAMPWPTDGLRRGSVNCFGFGGTNAHTVLEDAAHYLRERNHDYSMHRTVAPFVPPRHRIDVNVRGKAFLFPYSAHDKRGVKRMAEAHLDYLQTATSTDPELFLADYSYTLLERRSILGWKSFVVARSAAELTQKLGDMDVASLTKSSRAGPVQTVLAFCGQGAQWHAMARELAEDYPVFCRAVCEASSFLGRLGATFDVFEELGKNLDQSMIDEPHIAQPATTVLQMALVDLLAHIGIKPIAVVGHSSGEIAAAYAKGALSRQDGWKIAYYRGQAAIEVGRMGCNGAMTAVWRSSKDTQTFLDSVGCDGFVSVACINSPEHTTISGDLVCLEKVETKLNEAGVRFARLRVSVAYHSRHMRLVEGSYMANIKDIKPLPGNNITMFSSVSGRMVENHELGPEYWCRNMVSPVRFPDAVDKLMECVVAVKQQATAIMELGPHGMLRLHFEAMLARWEDAPLYVSLLSRGKDAAETLMGAIGEVFEKKGSYPLGFSPSRCILEVEPGAKLGVCVDLPPYPFNHETRYIWESHLEQARVAMHLPDQRQDIIGRPIPSGSEPDVFRWRQFLRPDDSPWIRHHVVDGAVIYPAAGLVAMVVQAGFQISQHPAEKVALHQSIAKTWLLGFKVSDMTFEKGIAILDAERGVEVNLSACRKRNDPTSFDFVITYSAGGILASRGSLQLIVGGNVAEDVLVQTCCRTRSTICRLREECQTVVDVGKLYQDLEHAGLEYGPLFRGIVLGSHDDSNSKSIFEVSIGDTRACMPMAFEFDHLIHPTTLDSIFQSMACLGSMAGGMVPTKVGTVFISTGVPRTSGTLLVGHNHATRIGNRKAIASFSVVEKAFEKAREPSRVEALNLADSASHTIIIKDLEVTSIKRPSIPDNQGLCSMITFEDDVNHAEHDGGSVEEFVRRLAFKKPALSVLMIGTDLSLLDTILDHMNKSNIPLAIRNTTFVEDGRSHQRRAEHKGCQIDIIPLNSERPFDSVAHGSQAFDLVIIGDVLQGCYYQLDDVARLLADGGTVLKQIGPDVQLDNRLEVDTVLTQAGGKKFTMKPSPPIEATSSTLHRPIVAIVVPGDISRELEYLLESLSESLDKMGFFVTHFVLPRRLSRIKLEERSGVSCDFCISLMEAESPYLANWEGEDFDHFKHFFSHIPKLLWLTRGAWPRNWGYASASGDPSASMFWGLARTIWSESWENVQPVVVDLDPTLSLKANPAVYTSSLVSIFLDTLAGRRKYFPSIQDREFLLHVSESGRVSVKIPRLVPMQRINRHISQGREDEPRVTERVWKSQENDVLAAIQTLGAHEMIPGAADKASMKTQATPDGLVQALDCLGEEAVPLASGSPSFPPSPVSLNGRGGFQNGQLDPGSTYMVVGGFGGLGRAIVDMMVKGGAKNVAIMSRGGGTGHSQSAREWIGLLEERGVKVVAFFGDVSHVEDVQRVVGEMSREMPMPIKGVVMAATVVADAAFERMTFEQWKAVVAVKAHGSLNLDSVLRNEQVDFFIMLSSAAGVIGNMTQANYNAANVVQDMIALYRHRRGQNCVAIDLGPVRGAGMVDRDEDLAASLDSRGFISVGFGDFEHIIRAAMVPGTTSDGHSPYLHPNTVVGIGTGGLEKQNKPSNPFWSQTALYSYLAIVDLPEGAVEMDDETAKMAEKRKGELLKSLCRAASKGEKSAVISRALVEAVVNEVGNRSAEDVDAKAESPATLGIDSLTGIGVRDWVRKALGVNLSIMEIIGGTTFSGLAEMMVKRM
ncbi:hypothetical protein MKZ38_010021 [Zalerion maritima]|uniref:Polyketide synthase n=1 Tax=Zalerion maritima TaxID=339359 RepID=A0AAD5WT66_9PEZI|nr:hypothetical protein MKZ38_010021 [Zalerion maritima]